MPLDAEPIEYFSKYLIDEITDIMCKETNRYAEQYFEYFFEYLNIWIK